MEIGDTFFLFERKMILNGVLDIYLQGRMTIFGRPIGGALQRNPNETAYNNTLNAKPSKHLRLTGRDNDLLRVQSLTPLRF